jgi:amino acid transporter
VGAGIESPPELHRALGTVDLVLLNVAAIVGLRYLSIAAQIGPSSLTLWLLWGILWFSVVLNILGLERSKWLQNVGAVATWMVGALVLCGGFLAWHRFGAATPITARGLVPNLRSLPTVASFATMALAYSGLELGPILGGEIKNPRRTIARALLIACVAIGILYIAGTSALFMALPAQQINAISGIPQALSAIAMRAGVPMFGFIAAALVTLSQIGSLGAWITGTARLPFLFGLHRYLPRALGAVHPVSGSPYVALLTQGILASLVLLAAISGSAVHDAYLVLIDMTVILSLLPSLFAAAVEKDRHDPHRSRIPGSLR